MLQLLLGELLLFLVLDILDELWEVRAEFEVIATPQGFA